MKWNQLYSLKIDRVASAFVIAVGLCIALPQLVLGSSQPEWWTSRKIATTSGTFSAVISTGTTDYAAVNQGQVKQFATAAFLELSANLPGGVGSTAISTSPGHRITALVNGWSKVENGVRVPLTGTNTRDYGTVNQAQIKTVIQPFYDRLLAVGYTQGPLASGTYPWVGAAESAAAYDVANIGEVKNLFNFNVTYKTDPSNPLPDWWQLHYFGKLGVNPSALAPAKDGYTNLQEYQLGRDPL